MYSNDGRSAKFAFQSLLGVHANVEFAAYVRKTVAYEVSSPASISRASLLYNNL